MNKGFFVLILLFALNCRTSCQGSDAVGKWVVRQPLPTANQLHGVAYGDGKFVAVGELGTIVVSGDGTNWSRVASGVTTPLYAVACGDRGFVAVGGGTILRSIHGINWFRCPPQAYASLNAVTYGAGRFVTGGGAILSSTDGLHWIQHTNPLINSELTGIAYGNTQFVGVAYGSSVTSQDGINWAVHPLALTANNPFPYPIGITYGDGKFVAVGQQFAATSSDGINWEDPTDRQTETFSDVAYGNGVFAATAWNAGRSATATSQHGDSWITNDLGRKFTLQGIAFGNGQFVAVGWDGAIATSVDGFNWASQAKGFGPDLHGVAFGRGQYVAVGSQGNVFRSSAGASWSRVQVDTTNNLACVTFMDGRFVAGGAAGTILTSTTGTNWIAHAPVCTNTIQSISYGNGIFVAGGADIFIDYFGNFRTHTVLLVSKDGASWRQTFAENDMGFFNISFGNGRFVACRQVGIYFPISEAWVSENGVDWRVYALPGSANVIAFGNGHFIAAGYGEKFLSSVDGVHWKTQVTPFVDESASGIAYGGGKFIVSGEFGTLMSSADGVRWTLYQPVTFSSLGLFGVCCGQNSCVAVGAFGKILQARLLPGY